MKISEASKIAGVSKRTLQYYDDEGLLSVKRMENNHRDYDLESLQIIWKILNLKEMGFELEEIRRLLVQDRISFDEKKEEIRKKIKDYQIQYKYIEYIERNGFPEINKKESYIEQIEKMKKEIDNNIIK
ncbi:MAG: MerR family transcriptional regulator [Floccifex porci]|uniref:MerR family transcriptional regulator n=1 Tax=Floccifex porci TaxID=2606629 RepID=UPI0023F26FAE|nr:MerR family transcriptional regulator [Floccifex porci]MCI7802022.1 MerR family transcriptional regulator [Erysipelotrichaceae bacterium]MDD7466922.1 MerR family transcriptional regulator [Floccifex porci]MDO4480641.1 MerR family transcriptional regulator [Erysipelotrichaceae bacterium]MDY4797390.1 MerR family transcriptional regulator [Floccifex porci]